MRLDKSYNLPWIKLDRFYNLTISRTNLDTNLGVKFVYKLAKSLTKISNRVHKSKTYSEAIDDPIYRNRWHKTIYKKLWNLDLY